MTEKQFVEPYEECRVIKNIHTGETATYYDTEDGLMFLKWLNNLSDENEQLKQEMRDLGTVHAEEINKIEDEFDEEILKLEKENEQLKQENNDLIRLINDLGSEEMDRQMEEILND